MDLSRAFPRSPKQKMAGLVHLGRMIDKGRAYKEKKLADYIYPCPLDKIILNFLRIDANTFANMTIEKKDEEISDWAKGLVESKSQKELGFINEQILQRKPDSEDRLKYFNEIRNKIDPSRSDVTTWVDLLDLEEGRLPPKPS
ncbi:MAG: DUF5069 domain-containing protein [Nitrospinae bacterium]|nr:DUF5069 domain-containing protein [Nitrospinota bacterium]MZH04542.1 DUF5069 domain-containing protein [Nitrospinota bacterium]MZH15264.1 DUF5069 domain-containing protein [Nitrospinota bacterium]